MLYTSYIHTHKCKCKQIGIRPIHQLFNKYTFPNHFTESTFEIELEVGKIELKTICCLSEADCYQKEMQQLAKRAIFQ